jgi:hypothetical protein
MRRIATFLGVALMVSVMVGCQSNQTTGGQECCATQGQTCEKSASCDKKSCDATKCDKKTPCQKKAETKK